MVRNDAARDYEATRRARGKRRRIETEGKPAWKIFYFGCTNIDCRYSWAECCAPSNTVGICPRCGAAGNRT